VKAVAVVVQVEQVQMPRFHRLLLVMEDWRSFQQFLDLLFTTLVGVAVDATLGRPELLV
jgi:hypothetical protein